MISDHDLGVRLRELRAKNELTIDSLARLINADVQELDGWENGLGKPSVDMVGKLALALDVTLDELLADPERNVQITKIVITGGPCAGKTTAMSWIQNAFTQKGYVVFFVPETATELISGGAQPWMCKSNKDFQAALIRLQLTKEETFIEIARHMGVDKALIVCDRAALDNKAYMTELEFQYVLRKLKTNEVALRDNYDAVFHLVTAAKGAVAYYTLANNAARTESIEQAVALDDKLIASWTGHPHFRVIDNTTEFEEKMVRLMAEISSFLGEPQPMEIERKYLIEYPDLQRLADLPNCSKIEISQTYLSRNATKDETRIRQRGIDGHYIYTKTVKHRVSDEKRVEIEARLSEEEYLRLLLDADPDYRQLRKTRYCLSEHGLYYEIDVFPFWKDKAIMEIELRAEDETIVIPDGIKVIREVTGDPQYRNHSLARI